MVPSYHDKINEQNLSTVDLVQLPYDTIDLDAFDPEQYVI